MSRRLRGTARGLVLLMATALAAGACGAEATDEPTLPTIADDSSANESSAEESSAGEDGTDDSAVGEGGSGEDSDAPVDPDLVFAAYEACMQEQGVDVSFGDSGGGAMIEESSGPADEGAEDGASFSAPPDDFDAAAEICDPILEDAFGDFEMSPEEQAEMEDQMLALERCMAEQGIEFQDSENGAFMIETDDQEALDEAFRICEDEVGLEFEGSEGSP